MDWFRISDDLGYPEKKSQVGIDACSGGWESLESDKLQCHSDSIYTCGICTSSFTDNFSSWQLMVTN